MNDKKTENPRSFTGKMIRMSVESLAKWEAALFPESWFERTCVKVRTFKPIRLNERVLIAILLPDKSAQQIIGRIVWIRPLGGGDREIGILLDKDPDLRAIDKS